MHVQAVIVISHKKQLKMIQTSYNIIKLVHQYYYVKKIDDDNHNNSVEFEWPIVKQTSPSIKNSKKVKEETDDIYQVTPSESTNSYKKKSNVKVLIPRQTHITKYVL